VYINRSKNSNATALGDHQWLHAQQSFFQGGFRRRRGQVSLFWKEVRQPIAPALGDRGEAVSAARMRRELIPTIFRVEFLEAEINAKGMTVFARIDHAAGAAEVGLPLRPTELLIAKAGTPAHARQPGDWHRSAPLKALVHEDATGKVWLTCNDPHWLAKRHGVAVAQTVDAMAATLNAVATKATKSP
jgi:uncharacterized protein (DUF302 family)